MPSVFDNIPGLTLADADVAQLTAQNIIEMQNALKAQFGVTKLLGPADPLRSICYSWAAREAQWRSIINFEGLIQFPKYSIGPAQDNLYGLFGKRGLRKTASAASCLLNFTLGKPATVDVVIPNNTLVSVAGSNGNITFATVSDVTIPAGSLSAIASASCLAKGPIGNGYTAGQVSVLGTLNIPFLATVTNTDTTQGGADDESDTAYRERMYFVPDSFSVAGPRRAYQFWTLTVNPDIIEVAVWTPAPGEVRVNPLLQGAVLPNQAVLDSVQAFLSPQSLRPLNDYVRVQAPLTYAFSISLTYAIPSASSGSLATTQTAILNAVSAWNVWQTSSIGRSVSPSRLNRFTDEAGASEISVISPNRINLAGVPDELSQITQDFSNPPAGSPDTFLMSVTDSSWLNPGVILHLYNPTLKLQACVLVDNIPDSVSVNVRNMSANPVTIPDGAAGDFALFPSGSYVTAPPILPVCTNADNPTVLYMGLDFAT